MAHLRLEVLDPRNPADWFLCKAVIDESHACYEASIPNDPSKLDYDTVDGNIGAAYRWLHDAFKAKNEHGSHRLTRAAQDFDERNRAVFNEEVKNQWHEEVTQMYIAVLDNLRKRLEQKIRLVQYGQLEGNLYETCMTCAAPLVCHLSQTPPPCQYWPALTFLFSLRTHRLQF